MAFLRWHDPKAEKGGPRLLSLVTMKPDGSDIRLAVTPKQYARGGHHPMWASNGEDITINLNIRDGTKDLDLVVVNDATEDGAGFGVDTNRVTLVGRTGGDERLPLMPKRDVADAILDRVERLLAERATALEPA